MVREKRGRSALSAGGHGTRSDELSDLRNEQLRMRDQSVCISPACDEHLTAGIRKQNGPLTKPGMQQERTDRKPMRTWVIQLSSRDWRPIIVLAVIIEPSGLVATQHQHAPAGEILAHPAPCRSGLRPRCARNAGDCNGT